MKSTLCFSMIASLAILSAATPTIPNRALRVPLQRRPRNRGGPSSNQSTTVEQSLGAQGVANLIHYAHEKYASTFAAYERNTGSRHPLDTQSRSSSSLPLIGSLKRASKGAVDYSNQGVELWYGRLTIGTPPQCFTMDFDTGSADLIVPDRLCPETCNGHRMYDPTQSSTSEIPSVPLPFVAIYGSGQAIGFQHEDDVNVGGYQVLNQRFGSAELLSSDFSYPSFRPDGISGLAFKQISALFASTLMDNLKRSGQLPRPVFSFRLSTTPGKSQLLIGDTDKTAFNSDTLVSVPVTTKGFWQVVLDSLSLPGYTVQESVNVPAVIDTGTTLILAPEDVVYDYYSNIDGANCGNVFVDVCTVPCHTIDSTAPTLTFGGRGFRVSPKAWNLGPVEEGSSQCIAGLGMFEESFVIVGDVFLQNVYSIFDFSDQPRVQFAELKDV